MASGTKLGWVTGRLFYPETPERSRSFRFTHPSASQSTASKPAKPTSASSRKSKRRSDIVKPEKSTALPADAKRKTGDEFGIEGTNKTVAMPKPDNKPSDELGLGPHVEKTPYTRG
jgi:hypothetical protein